MSKGATINCITSLAVLALSVACGSSHGRDTTEILSGTSHDADPTTEGEVPQYLADEDFGLITAVDLGDGQRVEFFEPSEGSLAIVESFELAHRRELNLGQPVYAIWQDIAPDTEMPAALVRLADEELRALDNAASEPDHGPEGVDTEAELLAEGTSPEGEPKVAEELKHQTSDPVHWEVDQHGCRTLGNDLKWSWCWENRTASWDEATRTGEAIAAAVSVYSGINLTFCNRMGNDWRCKEVPGGAGQAFIGKVGTNFFGVHVDQAMQSRLTNVVAGTNWHFGGSISGNWSTAVTFGGYDLGQ